MGYTAPSGYCLQLFTPTSTPLANQTYYIGATIQSIQNVGSGAVNLVYLPLGGTINKIVFTFKCTAGTNEATTLVLRKNNATDYTLTSTLDCSSANQTLTFTNLAIPMATGDSISIKLVCPNWVTAPTLVFVGFIVFIQT